jgi:uncharacterized membrane protein
VLPPKDLASNKDVNVYYIEVYTKFNELGFKAILDFVKKGGGLLIAGHCYQCFAVKMKPSQLPGNR